MTTTLTPSYDALPISILELFQAQGCSSCPLANAAISTLLSKSCANTLILTHDVTCRDHLGCPDTSGLPESDERLREYSSRLKNSYGRVYMPQAIMNGLASDMGSTPQDLDSVITKGVDEARFFEPISLKVVDSGTAVIVNALVTQAYETLTLMLVRYDPQPVEVNINAGENAGRRLLHQNIVKNIKKVGVWGGGVQRFEIPKGLVTDGLPGAILVHSGRGGAIVAAVRV